MGDSDELLSSLGDFLSQCEDEQKVVESNLSKNPNPQPAKDTEVFVEQHSRIPVWHWMISPTRLSEIMCGTTFVPCKMLLSKYKEMDEDETWATIGVVVKASTPLKSNKGSKFLIWKIADFSQDNSQEITFALFSDAEVYWKILPGTVVLFFSPSVLPKRDKDKEISFSVNQSSQIEPLGICPDYATCDGTKADGGKCSLWVNKQFSTTCKYHLGSEIKRISKELNKNVFPRQVFVPKKEPSSLNIPIKAPSERKIVLTPLQQQAFARAEITKRKAALILQAKKNPLPAPTAVVSVKQPNSSQTTLRVISQVKKTDEPKIIIKQKNIIHPLDQFKIDQDKAKLAIKRPISEISSTVKSTSQPDELSRAKRINIESKFEPNRLSGLSKEEMEKLKNATSKFSKYRSAADERNELTLKLMMKRAQQQEENNRTWSKKTKAMYCASCRTYGTSTDFECKELGHFIQLKEVELCWFQCLVCSRNVEIYGNTPYLPCLNCRNKEFKQISYGDYRKFLRTKK